MIAVLISDAVERAIERRQVFWLQGILENGFSGFAAWSDEQLRAELAERGFDLAATSPDDAGDAWENDSWESDELLMLAGHIGFGGQLPCQ